jgi:AcrR family transcriptional regulator
MFSMEKKPPIAKRGPGRPRLTGNDSTGLINRNTVIDLAYEQARTQPLDAISFVQIAQTLGVAPGSLHYHIGTKDDLTSAILKRFYKGLLTDLRKMPPGLDWMDRLRFFARVLMASKRAHRGASEHIQTRARFRLFQKVSPGETDWGAAYLDWAFTLFREAGFDAEDTALCYHVLAMHCLAAATSTTARLGPADHDAFLIDRADTLDEGTTPGLDFALRAFARVKSDDAFEFGLEALLARFAAVRSEA